MPVAESGLVDSENWARVQLQVFLREDWTLPGALILVGFEAIDSAVGRPERDVPPAHHEVLALEPDGFPMGFERWLHRDLAWFVLAAPDESLESEPWMSDALDLASESVVVDIGAAPKSANVASVGIDEPPPGPDRPSAGMSWAGLLVLALVPLGLGWLMGRETEETQVSRHQIGLQAIGAGVILAVCSDLWLADIHLDRPFTSTHLLENCDGVVSLLTGDGEWTATRSRLAGYLPAIFAKGLGIVDGFRAASWVCAGLVGAGILVWARCLGGALAGWVAVAAALTLGPLTHLPRMLSFYPEMTAAFTWGAAVTTWAVLKPGMRSALWAGAALSLCCLIDLRGIPYAAVWGVGLGVALLLRLRKEARWPLMALLTVCLFSWPMGRLAYTGESVALDQQLEQVAAGEPVVTGSSSLTGDEQFNSKAPSLVWGHTPVLELPQAVWSGVMAWPESPAETGLEGGEVALETQVTPWLPIALSILPLALWGAWRRSRSGGVAALLLSSFPSLLALPVVVAILVPVTDSASRFFTQLMPALAVGMGVAFVALYHAIPGSGRFSLGRWPRRGILIGLLAAGVAGWLPTPVSPTAEWRYSWRAGSDHEKLGEFVSGDSLQEGQIGSACVEMVRLESGGE